MRISAIFLLVLGASSADATFLRRRLEAKTAQPECAFNSSSPQSNVVSIKNWNYGRLGNTLASVKNAVRYSLHHKCDLLLPDTLIGITNYSVPKSFFCTSRSPSAVNNHMRNASMCNISHNSDFWWNTAVDSSQNVDLYLQEYIGLNRTHSFGHECLNPEEASCLGVHVRSGDVFRGDFNVTDGHWNPSAHIHSGYQQPPLEYYLFGIKSFLQRHRAQSGRKVKVIIACEDLLNPVCEILDVLSEAEDSWQFVQDDLKKTLQAITCCEEVLLAQSSLSLVLQLSPRLRHLHYYSGYAPCGKSEESRYNVTRYRAVGYNYSQWHNTELERHNLLRPYEIEQSSCLTAHQS